MAPGARVISLEELQQHKKAESCWLLLHGKVYDVTDFLEEHPGGYDIIVSCTGGAGNGGQRWGGGQRSALSRMRHRARVPPLPCPSAPSVPHRP